MCKILIAGEMATHLKVEKYLGEQHSIHIIKDLESAKINFDNGYYDFIIASQNGNEAIITNILQHVRNKSSEAIIIVMLSKNIFDSDTLKWVYFLAENIGIDYFIPCYDNTANDILKIAVTSAATRIKQRSLGPRFNELANKIMLQLA